MTARQALAFVKRHGVVLQAARGPVPTLTHEIAGEPIRGSWWGHSAGTRIFNVLEVLHASPDIAACRLVRGKVTLMHRRLWPALARLASALPKGAADRIRQNHMPSGEHRTTIERFPAWLPERERAAGMRLREAEARAVLGRALGDLIG